MFTIKLVDSTGVETNQVLGDSYNVILLKDSPSIFNQIFNQVFKQDFDITKNKVRGFLKTGGGQFIPLTSPMNAAIFHSGIVYSQLSIPQEAPPQEVIEPIFDIPKDEPISDEKVYEDPDVKEYTD